MLHTEGRESHEDICDTTDDGDNLEQSHNGPFSVLLHIIKSEPLGVHMLFFFVSFYSCNGERFQIVVSVDVWNRQKLKPLG